MQHRLIGPALVLVFALAAVALPTQAKAPPSAGTASVTIADALSCRVTVTYVWDGFRGRDLTALVGVRWPGPAGSTFWIWDEEPVSGSGSLSPTFELTGYGTHVYSGFGRLLGQKGRDVSGSFVVSPTGVSLTC